MQRRLTPTLALALLGATLFSPLSSLAQIAPGAPPAAAPGSAPAKPTSEKPGPDPKILAENKAMATYKAMFDAKLAGLQAGLQLTGPQAPLWAPVETAIRALAKTHFAIHHPGEGEPSDAREQLERTSDRLIRAGQAMKTLADATGPLMAALDPDQKDRLAKLLHGLPPQGIIRKAFNVTEDRPDESSSDGERYSRMDRDHHSRRDGARSDRFRDDERSGDQDTDGDRDERYRGHRHGDRDYHRHRDAEDGDRGSDRHRGDMDDVRS